MTETQGIKPEMQGRWLRIVKDEYPGFDLPDETIVEENNPDNDQTKSYETAEQTEESENGDQPEPENETSDPRKTKRSTKQKEAIRDEKEEKRKPGRPKKNLK